MTLETITGTLDETYKKVNPRFISSSAEIRKEGKIYEQLARKWFWTRQSAVYSVEGGEVLLHLTDRVEDNLVFQDIGNATRALIRDGNYFPDDKRSIESIVGSVEGFTITRRASPLL